MHLPHSFGNCVHIYIHAYIHACVGVVDAFATHYWHLSPHIHTYIHTYIHVWVINAFATCYMAEHKTSVVYLMAHMSAPPIYTYTHTHTHKFIYACIHTCNVTLFSLWLCQYVQYAYIHKYIHTFTYNIRLFGEVLRKHKDIATLSTAISALGGMIQISSYDVSYILVHALLSRNTCQRRFGQYYYSYYSSLS
jgi:hypothetical protein